MNDYFYKLAKRAAEIANSYAEGEPIKPEYVYAQWYHETGGFTSAMCVEFHNLGGLTQVAQNDTLQPDGNCYYMQFATFEDYAEYFGKYLHYYDENGIYESKNADDYVKALKDGGYFGDTLENYLAGVHSVLDNME